MTAAILAGGRGARLGGAFKPLLTVGGRTILARQLAAFAGLVDEILIVVADRVQAALVAGAGPRVVLDARPGEGPLAGLESALAAARGERVLVVGGDQPLLRPSLLAHLRDAAPEAIALAPRVGDRWQPLIARHDRALLPAVRAALDGGERSPSRLLDALGATAIDEPTLRRFDPDLSSLDGANTPAELAALIARFDSAGNCC